MSEFTKGKWEVNQKDRTLCVTCAYGDKLILARVAIYDDNDEDLPPETAKANARLIAAAPEMYDELYDTLQLLKGKSSYDGDEFDKQARSIQELLDRIDGKGVNA